MAYTKRTWDCGDKITADALNHMEQGIYDAQNGYECVESYTLLTQESVTTTDQGDFALGNFTYADLINADKIKVTFNGVEYECNVTTFGTSYLYGADDDTFSSYPFTINSGNSLEAGIYRTILFTPSAGTYNVKIEIPVLVAETSECFEKAVESVVAGLLVRYDGIPIQDGDITYYLTDKTWQEVHDALATGKNVGYIPHYDFNNGAGGYEYDIQVVPVLGARLDASNGYIMQYLAISESDYSLSVGQLHAYDNDPTQPLIIYREIPIG